eukprot:TRINITY_DN66020_c0_g1_i1.p2 TRINITY_DN66020_c0_g1~~TRINITY_DN66020_c0_g1_i1.p2  ORF type:complete len:255 (+),score=94.63 TRINITY_DN66020_c0_g1_i1:69-767(+)
MRRSAGAAVAATARRARLPRRCIVCWDGVTDDDRRWWEWHIPVRPHKAAETTVLYCDGVGRFTWKKLIERDVFTVKQLAELDDTTVQELKVDGCTAIHVAREHARVFMQVMDRRDSELSRQQSSWQKEAERVLRMREERMEADRARWAAANRFFGDQALRERVSEAQQRDIQQVVKEIDFGPSKVRWEGRRFDDALGRPPPPEEGTIDVEAEEGEPGDGLGSQSDRPGNPFN